MQALNTRQITDKIAQVATAEMQKKDMVLINNLLKKGFTQTEIAELFGYTKQNINKIIKSSKK